MQKKDIDVNFLNKDGFTPIMIAATRKIYEIVEFLLNDERIDINYKTIFFLFDLFNKDGQCLLLIAYNNFSVFEKLIHRNDIDLNVVDERGYNIVHKAIELNNLKLVSYILDKKMQDMSMDTRTNDGSSFMHLAIKVMNIDLLTFLEKKGLNYNIQDNQGRTPLMILINTNFQTNAVWDFILKKDDIDINIKDKSGIL